MALQLRRGTNAERLAMTPLIGELIYVTDYELVTLSVTAIDAGTEELTSVAHGLAVNQQIKFQDASLNGLTLNQVYFVKTVPSSDTFTLSLTLGGSIVDITGTFTIPLVFAKTPTNAAGAPIGTGVSALWVGDGVTVGGIIAASLNLDDLLDVDITSLAEGNSFYYDATTGFWRNTAIITVDDVNNRVGVNTSSPAYTLDVNGVANIETSLTVPSISTLTGDDLTITAFAGRDVTISTTTAADPVTIVRNTAATNAFTRALTLRTNSSGTPAVGFGSALDFEVETAPNVTKAAGFVEVEATNVTTGDETFRMNFGLMNDNNTYDSVATLTSLGNLQIDGTLEIDGNKILNSTGNDTITMATGSTGLVTLSGNLTVSGNNINSSTALAMTLNGASVAISDDLQIGGADLTTSQTTFNLLNTTATTVNAFGAATTVSIGNASGTVTIPGNLTINGTTTNINTTNLLVEDKNITIGDVTTPTDVTAAGGGITLLGATNKTITWNNATDGWEFNQAIKVTGNIVAPSANIGVIDINITAGQIDTNSGSNLTLDSDGGTVFINDNLNVDAGVLYVDAGNNYVGINDTTPSFPLDVNGAINTNDTVYCNDLVIDGQSTHNTQTTTTTTTSATTISSTTRKTQKVVISITDNVSGEIHVLEALAFQKSTTGYLTTYAEIYSNAALATFTADVSGGAIRILATPASTNSTTFTVARVSLD